MRVTWSTTDTGLPLPPPPSRIPQYPQDCSPLVQHRPHVSAACAAHRHSGAIVQLSFSPDCSWLATASADGTAHVLRCGGNSASSSSGGGGKGGACFSSSAMLVGHKGALRCVNWSHDGRLLATAAADRTVRLWSPLQAAPLLQLEPLPDGSGGRAAAQTSGKGGMASAEVCWAQFAYMDELLLVAAGNQLQAYRWLEVAPAGKPELVHPCLHAH